MSGPGKEIEFASLKAEIDGALGQGKAVIISDASGRSSSFLQYNCSVMDCKGLFVLDKMHGAKTDEEITEAARTVGPASPSAPWALPAESKPRCFCSKWSSR